MAKTGEKGVQEWADQSLNSQKGCTNNCKYCYARRTAPFLKLMPQRGWQNPEYRSKEWILERLFSKDFSILTEDQIIMYPSIHDITPDNYELCEWTIDQALAVTKAKLLIVSKPNLALIDKLSQHLLIMKERIEFRFTIGGWFPATLLRWEPEAPDLTSRLQSVELVIRRGFNLSISLEPLLEPQTDVIDDMITWFEAHNIQTIWIGAMNYMRKKVIPELDFTRIYDTFRANPHIKWKESFAKHLNED